MCMYQLSKCICGLSEEVYVFIGVLRSEVAINILSFTKFAIFHKPIQKENGKKQPSPLKWWITIIYDSL